MSGWVKLHRCLFEKPIWTCSTPEQKVVLITLLGMANHKENEWEWKGQKFKCESGQFVTSEEHIAKKAQVGRESVRSSLKKFEKYEFLTKEATKTGTLVTIVNWGVYQGTEEIPTNKSTKTQPSTNQEPTTNKNDKNDKKDNSACKEKFNLFWKAYPKKKGKKTAETSFMRISPNDETFNKMMTALGEQKKTDQWTKDNGQFIPFPSTWLNQERWNDEVDVPISPEKTLYSFG